MWKLKNTKKEHQEYFIFVGDEFVVGRKDSDLLISNDPSVSRRHAVLYVKHPEENLTDPSKKSSLFLRDEGSKYGTFKNGVRITAEVEVVESDMIKFGQFESEFRVQRLPLVVTTSCLDVSAKSKLKKTIHILGGHFVSEWQSACSHLVMSQVKVTIKALCCLVSLKPIVVPHYFQELEKSLRSSASVIPFSHFIPPIGESLIDKDKVSFDVEPQRKEIFKDKTFFFMDAKQFKKLHLGIVLAGGNSSLIDDKTDLQMLLHHGSCFIEPVKDQVVTEQSKKLLKQVLSVLKKKNWRMIPESDIGLAVAYCSTEKYCNAEFNIGAAVLGSQKIDSQTLSEREVYVPDTQERSLRNEQKSKKPHLEDCDSLNLTTYRTGVVDEMDVFEIPLSAQVKQEIDDFLEETIPNKDVLDADFLPATLPLDPEEEIKRNAKIKEEISTLRENISMKQNKANSFAYISPQKENVSVDLSKNASADIEPDLPRNVMKIEFAPLICKKRVSVVEQNRYSSVKNFKKFRKVYPLKAQALPRIIGIHELVPHDKDAVKMFNDDWDDPMEDGVDEPVKGEFDWETPNG